MKTSKLSGIGILGLILSLVFILPLNLAAVSAAENTQPEITEFSKTRENIQDTCSLTPPVDVKSSIVLSIVMMCLPGILDKAYEWKQIKCEKALCSYEAVVNSLDPTFCEKEAGFKTCKFIVGEVFAIPPMSILEHLRKTIANALANPVGLLYSAAVITARITVSGNCNVPMLCNVALNVPFGVAKWFLVINDGLAVAQNIMDIMDNGFIPPLNPEDSCDQLENIRTELEKIVAEE